MDATTAKARWIDTAEAAKLIRRHLKATFPGVKFSVRTRRYSGGSSVDVAWTDGPTVDHVEKITHGFSGRRFEGMTDCAYGADSWYCPKHGARPAATYGADIADNNGPRDSRCCSEAELVHFGSGYVPTSRQLSPEFRDELRARVNDLSGLPLDADEDTHLPEGSLFQHYPYDTVREAIHRLSRDTAA